MKEINVHDEEMKKLLTLQPLQPVGPLKTYAGTLRHYQKTGLDWLMFLYDNGFGGLLCDDMGLGKTHQIIALIAAIREQRTKSGRMIVVCPATVVSHGEKVLSQFGAALDVHIFYGQDRNVKIFEKKRSLVLTYYGIVRNDIDIFSSIEFDCAFFDEAQNLKNPGAEMSKAAMKLRARMKYCLTGTPVENSVVDLKSRMDLAVIGYLGTEILETQAGELKTDLLNTTVAIPFLHVFAVLTTLKQVGNHPALYLDRLIDYPDFASGKSDLFCELVAEALGAQRKIVIFAQFLGMVEIIRLYLTSQQIGHVCLTGSSTNRGAIVKNFNTDPQCRVFIGSLKAGGVGIDLTAASVVIHYDRWWNAARENQATDRVYRISQGRGVSVFKLISRGTLEEKIDQIIQRKKDLAEAVLNQDDAIVTKSFTREELLELLGLAV